MTQRIAFTVHGTVQGVTYRAFTQKKASAYGLTGWVRNTSNGNVEGEAQGEEASVTKLLRDLDSGPRFAHVTKVDKAEVDVKSGESSFKVT